MFNNHRMRYKNEGIDSNELRRWREEDSVRLRKEKREIELFKRRNIYEISRRDDSVAEQYTLTDWSSIRNDVIKNLYSIDEEEQLKATLMFKKLLISIPDLPIYAVISTGIVPQLVKFLKNATNSQLQFEAAWVLTNIAAGTSEQTRIVLEADAVQIFIQLLESPHTNIRQQAVWALGNIASDSATCRNYVLNMGIMEPLLNLINNCKDIPMVRISVWALSNLCRGTIRSPSHYDMVLSALPVLDKLLCHQDTEVLYVVCWTLSYLCQDPNERIQRAIDDNICSTLVKLLMHSKQSVSYAALQAVGNIVIGSASQIQMVLKYSILSHLRILLKSSDHTIRKAACWIISNITGNESQIQIVLNENIFPAVIHIMASGEFNTKKEAARVIKNVTSVGTQEQIQYLVEKKCIPPLCDLLTSVDVKIIKLALESLENILMMGKKLSKRTSGSNQYAALLEECYGLEKIEVLMQHENNDIYLMALGINEYFASSDSQGLLT